MSVARAAPGGAGYGGFADERGFVKSRGELSREKSAANYRMWMSAVRSRLSSRGREPFCDLGGGPPASENLRSGPRTSSAGIAGRVSDRKLLPENLGGGRVPRLISCATRRGEISLRVLSACREPRL
jgi:hypothetical protein